MATRNVTESARDRAFALGYIEESCRSLREAQSLVRERWLRLALEDVVDEVLGRAAAAAGLTCPTQKCPGCPLATRALPE